MMYPASHYASDHNRGERFIDACNECGEVLGADDMAEEGLCYGCEVDLNPDSYDADDD